MCLRSLELHRKDNMTNRFLTIAVALTAALMISACSGGKGYSRGIFHGLVIDKTEAEVTDKLGKPESVEQIGSDGVRYVYRRKTFDPDNANSVDEKTFVDPAKPGALVCEPLKAAVGVANATPRCGGHLKVAGYLHRPSCSRRSSSFS